MKPYESEFVKGKIEEYNLLIKNNSINKFKINKKENFKSKTGYMYERELDLGLDIVNLERNGNSLMKISAIEIESSYMFIKHAKGTVGIVGLGLGYVVSELLKKEEVKKIIVYEKEKEIIDLYNLSFKADKRLKIINEDAYKAKKDKFDYFFVDIYDYKLTNKVVEDYKKFNKLHEIKEYLFWGIEHFLLSCKYEEIVWVYIPELWMEMSKDIFTNLEEAGLLNYYKQLDEDLVSNILKEFKEVLDE
ncbi:hypothetical protein [Clostridium sp.]|uniref:hypothetical protein n=1 Tax=Clostridium sp. TaxID=1506 RepID=UPI0026235C4D|nr:hypothetical protein [Clostridium sp.]